MSFYLMSTVATTTRTMPSLPKISHVEVFSVSNKVTVHELCLHGDTDSIVFPL
jgi:hypothetical protein